MDLINLKTKEDLKKIIIEELGYPTQGELPFQIEVEDSIRDKIESSTIIATWHSFGIVHISINSSAISQTDGRFDMHLRAIERKIINKIDKSLRKQYLFVFSSMDGEYWHFVNAQSSGNNTELRRFSINPSNRNKLRTATSRLQLIKVDSSDDIQTIVEKHKKAFDVEEVTMEFFRIFANKFLELIDIIKKSRQSYSDDPKIVRDVSQIILNRLVFLKFIEQKSWLDGNTDYLYNKFQPYYSSNNSYWRDIVTPLFALLSDPTRDNYSELGQIPFLNGGLFGSEPKDLFLVDVPNSFFEDLFDNLLNRFNFTIEESAPNSVEVAVDPEMLGRIFEELVLRLEKTAEKSEAEVGRELRRETGSYYTPRVAVFFMCREAISRRLSDESNIDLEIVKKIIDLALDELPDKEQVENIDLSISESQGLLRAVEKLTICDPAVGSGAFLLGALQMLTGLRRFLILKIGDERAQRANFDYSLKAEIIRDNLVGVDIMLQAVHICELRLWLSLAVDYKREGNELIPTLPNLTFKIFRGDSVVDHLYGDTFDYLEILRKNNIFSDTYLAQNLNSLVDLKRNYYLVNNDIEKEKLKEQIEEKKLLIAIEIIRTENRTKNTRQGALLPGLESPKQKQLDLTTENGIEMNQFINTLEILLKNKRYSEATKGNRLNFSWKIDLVEFFVDHGESGFDIVIGNPPYGVKNAVMVTGKQRYNLGSKDSYGVFIAMAVLDLLKPNGILSFITSDTWQTIKSHRDLRRMLLDNTKVHNLVMMPQWLFGATVNTSILIATKTKRGFAIFGKENEYENSNERRENQIIACDFTQAQKNSGELEEYLYSLDNPEYVSTPKKACYHYNQGLIETNSNWPFFVASPKLFSLTNDTKVSQVEKVFNGKSTRVRQIIFHDKTIELVRLGDIAEVKQGLATGDNKSYIFQNPDARGSYRSIEDYKKYLLTDNDFEKIRGDTELKYKVINKGFHKSRNESNFDDDLWFDGRYILPYDKGGEGDTELGWLPNYYVPTNYYIDWSSWSVNRLNTLTIGKRDNNSRDELCAVIRNSDYYFSKGISFSRTGIYAPTFRINSGSVFDTEGSGIFYNSAFDIESQVSVLASKFTKYLLKNYIGHTVHCQVDELNELPINLEERRQLNQLVREIISKQKKDINYIFMINEQIIIDKLVYEMYGLNDDDIREVETWYARRYPRLARFCDID